MDTDRSVKRWQDWGNLLLGAWLFVSPWVLQYSSDTPNATWNAYILGAAIVIFAALAVYMPRVWEEGLNVVLGAWMIVSPWVLGFGSHRDATANAAIVGVLVSMLAAWVVVWHFERRQAERRASKRAPLPDLEQIRRELGWDGVERRTEVRRGN